MLTMQYKYMKYLTITWSRKLVLCMGRVSARPLTCVTTRLCDFVPVWHEPVPIMSLDMRGSLDGGLLMNIIFEFWCWARLESNKLASLSACSISTKDEIHAQLTTRSVHNSSYIQLGLAIRSGWVNFRSTWFIFQVENLNPNPTWFMFQVENANPNPTLYVSGWPEINPKWPEIII